MKLGGALIALTLSFSAHAIRLDEPPPVNRLGFCREVLGPAEAAKHSGEDLTYLLSQRDSLRAKFTPLTQYHLFRNKQKMLEGRLYQLQVAMDQPGREIPTHWRVSEASIELGPLEPSVLASPEAIREEARKVQALLVEVERRMEELHVQYLSSRDPKQNASDPREDDPFEIYEAFASRIDQLAANPPPKR